MSRSKDVKYVLRPDLTNWNKAIRQLQRTMAGAAQAASQLFGIMHFLASTPDLRAKHGSRNFTGDGAWQSNMCAAWVHDSCPLPAQCDCSCHLTTTFPLGKRVTVARVSPLNPGLAIGDTGVIVGLRKTHPHVRSIRVSGREWIVNVNTLEVR